LKSTWQKETDAYSQANKKDMEQLQLILKEKTSGVLVKVKKKYEAIISMILAGTFLNILLSPFLHWLLGEPGPVMRMPPLLSLLTVIMICLIILFFYWMKYISLKTTIPADDLKLTLAEKIRELKQSFKHELYFLSVLFVVLFIIGRMVSQYNGNGNFEDIFRTDILLAMLGATLLLVFGLVRRKKQYDSNIHELKQYLSEFE
jgi:hypothetical protein